MTQQSSYATQITYDPTLETTVITLTYRDPANPTHSLSMAVAPELGSNLFRFSAGEHELIYSNQEQLKRKEFTGNFVLWPLPNRIRDCRYTYQGKTYSLAQTKRGARLFDEMLIHGLVFDLPWQYEQPVVHENAASVTTFIDITPQHPYYESYPFDSRLALTYTLSSTGIQIAYAVENRGTQDLPFGFALHPSFTTLAGKAQTRVSLPASAVMEADNQLLPTGRVLDVTGLMYSMFDLRQPTPVNALRLDHVYADLQASTPAIIDYGGLSMQLHITATDDFTHAVIYTLTGDNPFFCLEHQTCSTDAVNLHEQGNLPGEMTHLLELPPGQTHRGAIQYTVHFQ